MLLNYVMDWQLLTHLDKKDQLSSLDVEAGWLPLPHLPPYNR